MRLIVDLIQNTPPVGVKEIQQYVEIGKQKVEAVIHHKVMPFLNNSFTYLENLIYKIPVPRVSMCITM